MAFTISKKLCELAEVDKENGLLKFVDGYPNEAFSYHDINACTLVYEDAKAHGTSVPFSKKCVVGYMQSERLFSKYVYIGIQIVLKDGSKYYGYVYNEKLPVDTLAFFKHKKVAQEVVDVLKKVAHKNRVV